MARRETPDVLLPIERSQVEILRLRARMRYATDVLRAARRLIDTPAAGDVDGLLAHTIGQLRMAEEWERAGAPAGSRVLCYDVEHEFNGARLLEIERRLDALEKQSIEDLWSEIRTLRSAVQALTDRANRDQDALVGQYASLSDRVAALAVRLNTEPQMQQQLAQLDAKLQVERDVHDDLRRRIDLLVSTLTNTNGRLAALEAVGSEQKMQIETLLFRINDTQNSLQRHVSRIQVMENAWRSLGTSARKTETLQARIENAYDANNDAGLVTWVDMALLGMMQAMAVQLGQLSDMVGGG